MANVRIKHLLLSATLLVSVNAAAAAEKVTFQLGWVPGGDNGIEYLALAEGLFAAEGLEVTILSGNGASDTLTKLAAGKADLGLVGLEALMAAEAEQPMPVKAVFGLYSKKPDDIEVQAGSPVKAIADLAGKKVGIGSFSSSNVVWPLIAKQNGLDPSAVTMLKVDSGSLAPMLASGQVDAIVNWVTVAPLDEAVMKEVGKGLTVMPWSSFGYDGYGQSIVGNADFLKAKPAVVKAFLRAYTKAAAIAIKDPAAAGMAVHKIVPDLDPKVGKDEFAASVPLIDNDVSRADGLGMMTPERLETTWSWVAKSRSLDAKAIDPSAIVDMSFLPK